MIRNSLSIRHFALLNDEKATREAVVVAVAVAMQHARTHAITTLTRQAARLHAAWSVSQTVSHTYSHAVIIAQGLQTAQLHARQAQGSLVRLYSSATKGARVHHSCSV